MRLIPSDHVASLGHCLYTTLRLHDHRLLFWEEHLARLQASMRFFRFEPVLDPLELRSWIEQQAPDSGLCRITVTEREVLVSFRGFKPIPEQVTVLLTDHVVHPLLGLHKTGNHLPYTLAAQQTFQAGAFEGLMWDASNNHVVDGTRAGFLIQKDGLWTEPLGGLPSVTRQVALQELGVTARAAWITLEDLLNADHLWLCGSGMGVLPVHTLKWKGEERHYASSPLPFQQVGLIPPRAPEIP